MKRLTAISACAAALLLPSCMRWAIGEKILTAAETHVGLDYCHPIDNQLYCVTSKDGSRQYYAQLPEIRYRRVPYLISGDYYSEVKYKVSGATPTGRTSFAELQVDYPATRPLMPDDGKEAGTPAPKSIQRCKRVVPTLPSRAVPLPPANYRSYPYARKEDGTPDPKTAPGAFRTAVASSISYTLDPVLTVATTTAYWAVAIPAYTIAAPILTIRSQQAPPKACNEEPHEPGSNNAPTRP